MLNNKRKCVIHEIMTFIALKQRHKTRGNGDRQYNDRLDTDRGMAYYSNRENN